MTFSLRWAPLQCADLGVVRDVGEDLKRMTARIEDFEAMVAEACGEDAEPQPTAPADAAAGDPDDEADEEDEAEDAPDPDSTPDRMTYAAILRRLTKLEKLLGKSALEKRVDLTTAWKAKIGSLRDRRYEISPQALTETILKLEQEIKAAIVTARRGRRR